MAALSNAEQYYRKIVSSDYGYAYLEAMPGTGRQEQEWFECKGCLTLDRKTKEKIALNDSDIKFQWSRALSAFANTGGGVMVWGLDARKNEEGIDCVTDLALHEDAKKLSDRLKELLITAVDPPLSEIEITPLTKPDSKEGFVVCYVPQGRAKPHRGELAGANYYIRVGTSSKVSPVSLLRSLFYPNATARLVPSILVEPAKPNTQVKLHFCLKNKGSLSARNVSVFISHSYLSPFDKHPTDQVLPPPDYQDNIPVTLLRPINPDMDANCFYAFGYGSPMMLHDGLRVAIKVSCEDMPASFWSRQITFQEIVKPLRLEFIQV